MLPFTLVGRQGHGARRRHFCQGDGATESLGSWGTITDEEGIARRLHALIVTLSSSRYMFVWPTLRQTTEEICAGLDAAWRFFGGVPKHTVLDNATTMVVRASATAPGLNRSFREYAEARSFFPDTARVRHPKLTTSTAPSTSTPVGDAVQLVTQVRDRLAGAGGSGWNQ